MDFVLPQAKSIADVGCLNGDTFGAIQQKYDVRYTGIDIDRNAIAIAEKRYPEADFVVGDFMSPSFQHKKSDVVLALNLFDHFEDWKLALRNLKRLSSRYINVSSLLRLNGPSLVEPDQSFIHYSQGDHRLLWAVHNIYELAAYCATEDIAATSVFVYCYKKYDDGGRFSNIERAAHSVHAMPLEDILVGNVVVEFDDENAMSKTKRRPDLKIVVDDKAVTDSPWKAADVV